MTDFDGLKEHIGAILRELDQVQGSIDLLRKNEFENLKERSEILVELKQMVQKVESINATLHYKIDSINTNLTEQISNNNKIIIWIFTLLAGIFGLFKTFGIDQIINKKLGE